MIGRKQSFAALTVAALIGCAFAQTGKPLVPEERTMRDGLGRIITQQPDANGKISYYTLAGDTVEVQIEHTVDFIGGKDSLRSYLSNHYYGYVGPNAEELNQLAFFIVLLDDDLNVLETRSMNRGKMILKPPLDSLFVAALNASSGHWQKANPKDTLPRFHVTAVTYRIF